MTRIFVDTNVLLDLYRASTDKLDILDELILNKDRLIITRQMINEFFRNRAIIIERIINKFNESMNCNPFCTSMVRSLPEYAAVIKHRDSMKVEGKKIVTKLEQLLTDPSKDPIAEKFSVIITSTHTSVYEITDELIQKAQTRKLLGNPPSSDKYTIGDEVNWETLLANTKDDLAIVSRDGTFLDNFYMLSTEFNKRTQRNLLPVSDRITVALQKAGITPSSKAVKAEKSLAPPQHGARGKPCPKCGSSLIEMGLESDSGEIGWVECSKCDHFG